MLRQQEGPQKGLADQGRNNPHQINRIAEYLIGNAVRRDEQGRFHCDAAVCLARNKFVPVPAECIT